MRTWARGLAVVGGLALAGIAWPVAYIELGCRGSPVASGYRSTLPAGWRRPLARTWLTYPEWHIVYSADSLGRYLAAARPPSGYDYRDDIASFWTSYCAVNRATAGLPGAGDAKVMIYTIGISFSVEMAIKAAWEASIGHAAEALSGWTSANDRYAARVQQRYGTFMHETPWYAFPFGEAFGGLWQTRATGQYLRHWERRIALSGEYGAKAGYAKAIGAASGATLGRDQPTLRFVARAAPARIAAIDARLQPVGTKGGLSVVEAPRYAQFSDLLAKMAAAQIDLVEISGNDDVFVTILLPDGVRPAAASEMLAMPLGDRPGWRRVGVTVKVSKLLPLMRDMTARGGRVEHVYDY